MCGEEGKKEKKEEGKWRVGGVTGARDALIEHKTPAEKTWSCSAARLSVFLPSCLPPCLPFCLYTHARSEWDFLKKAIVDDRALTTVEVRRG